MQKTSARRPVFTLSSYYFVKIGSIFYARVSLVVHVINLLYFDALVAGLLRAGYQDVSVPVRRKKIKKKINNTKVNSYSQETFLAVTPSTAGWHRTALSRKGVCVVCYVPKASRGFPRLGTF